MKADYLKPLLAILVSLSVLFSAVTIISPARASEVESLPFEDTPIVEMTQDQLDRLTRDLAQTFENADTLVMIRKNILNTRNAKITGFSPEMWTPIGDGGDDDGSADSSAANFYTACLIRETALGELEDFARAIFGQDVINFIKRHAYYDAAKRIISNIKNGIIRGLFGRALGKALGFFTPNGLMVTIAWAIGKCIVKRYWN